jgi:hypothetical protein
MLKYVTDKRNPMGLFLLFILVFFFFFTFMSWIFKKIVPDTVFENFV